jgi:hypothetical protein
LFYITPILHTRWQQPIFSGWFKNRRENSSSRPDRAGAQLEQLFIQVLMLAREMGMLKLGKIAVDGSKSKANASRQGTAHWSPLRGI